MTIESGAAARIVSAYGPPMPPPPAPRPPRPAAIGGSTVLSFHVPEKFAVPCAGRTIGRARASTRTRCVFMTHSSLRRAGGLGHQRLGFVEMRGIGAGARLELLRAATEDFRREEAPFRIRRELVHGP